MQTRQNKPVRAFVPLIALLAFDLACALVVVHLVIFQAPNIEHLAAAQAFAADHRIVSEFLPVGYSGLLGLADLFAGQAGMTVLSVALQLLVIVAAWAYARQCGASVRAATTLAAFLSVCPDLLLSYHKAWDTAITALLLLLFLTFTLRVLHRTTSRAAISKDDVWLGLTLGYAVLVRPNLALLLPLAAIMCWHYRVPRALPRIVTHFALATAVYLAGTTALHGKPFVPHNGPYNLFAGTNPYTAESPLNMEDSIAPALRLLAPQVDRTDVGSRALEPVYMQLSINFIRQHPLQWLGLVGFKLRVMMLPDFKIHAAASLGGVLKIVAACAFPVWVMLSLFPPVNAAARQRRVLVAALTVVYLLPFLLTISSPRFRVPLDFVLWMDAGMMLWQRLTMMSWPSAALPD